MKKLLGAVIFAVAALAGYRHFDGRVQRSVAPSSADVRSGAEASETPVQGSGIIMRILPDDEQGSRHQRFILRLSSGRTLLIAHNIDLAPRVDGLKEGDVVEYSGEYVWNAKGGVVHWTHRDPSGRHAAGWLKHEGRTYQ